MKYFERLKELVSNSSDLQQNLKGTITNSINRLEINESERINSIELVKEIAREEKYFEVISSTDEFIIYKMSIADNQKNKDDWDIKYPYRVIMFKKERWERIPTVCETLDEALLTYLDYKHLSMNSGFAHFAMKMLNIKSNP